MGKTDHNAHSVYQLGVNPPADIAFGRIAEVRRIFREICFEEKLINIDLKFAKNTRPFM